MNQNVFLINSHHVVLLEFMTDFRHHLIDAGYTFVGFHMAGYKDALNHSLGAEHSDSWDNEAVSTASDVVGLEAVVSKTTTSIERQENLPAIHQFLNVCSMTCTRVKMRYSWTLRWMQRGTTYLHSLSSNF